MFIRSAQYEGSYVDVQACPQKEVVEFAFIGRSNVGKSSLINFLANHKDLARTSAQPGKTQAINYFLVNQQFYLVDLPGYGFAKVSKEKRSGWETMISGYLQKREQLACVFQLVDGSVPVQEKDIEFTNWMGEEQIPFAIVFTKTDKRMRVEGDPVNDYKKQMLEFWETLPPIFITSSKQKVGRDAILDYLGDIMKSMKN